VLSLDPRHDLGEVLDHSSQLVGPVALLAREAHKLTRARDNLTALGRPSDRDPAPAPELEQTFVAQDAKRTKHRVRVDTENRGEIARRGQPFTRPRLAVGDCAPNLSRNLNVQLCRLPAIDLDTEHDAIHSSFIGGSFVGVTATRQAEIVSRQPPRRLRERLSALIKEARERARRRRRRIAAAVIVLSAAAILALGGFFKTGYLSHDRNSVKGLTDTGTVLVAKRLILKGTSGSSIAAQNLFTVVTIPKEQIVPRGISDPAVLQGRVAAGDIYQNQQLATSDFTTPH
jgi:hypothetical protein